MIPFIIIWHNMSSKCFNKVSKWVANQSHRVKILFLQRLLFLTKIPREDLSISPTLAFAGVHHCSTHRAAVPMPQLQGESAAATSAVAGFRAVAIPHVLPDGWPFSSGTPEPHT